jgi:hypothetical protein
MPRCLRGLRLCWSYTLHTLHSPRSTRSFRPCLALVSSAFPSRTYGSPARTMTVSLFRTCTLSDTVALDRRLYTSPHILRIAPRIPGPVKPARNSSHGCTLLSVVRLSSSHCARPHPCTVTAAHHPHTRPPDIPARLAYQRSLLNTYRTSDLGRPRGSPTRPTPLALALRRRIFLPYFANAKPLPEGLTVLWPFVRFVDLSGLTILSHPRNLAISVRE